MGSLRMVFGVGAFAMAMMLGSGGTAVASVSHVAELAKQVHIDGRKTVIVTRRPPALRIEVRTRRPSRRHVWIDGHWRFHRGRYVWVRGRWVHRPNRGAVYVRTTWVRKGGGWMRVGGYWRH